ncbi:MAG: hypothetical protein ACXW15_06900, partial [Acidimicrobiia bacterium]
MARTRTLTMILGTMLLVAACSTAGDGTDEITSPTEAPDTTTTVATTTTAAPETTTTTAPTTTTTEPAEAVFEADWDPSFTLTTPPNWRRDSDQLSLATVNVFVFKAGSSFVVFSTEGPDSVDGWLEQLASNTGIVTTEPTPIELGSAPGYVVDVRLSDNPEKVCGFGIGPCSGLLTSGNGWSVVEGTPNRLWVVDVD